MFRVKSSIFSDILTGKNIVLKIDNIVFEKILRHIREEYPNEACGIMVGDIDGLYIVREVYRLKNILNIKYRFWFDIHEWIEKITYARKKGYKYIGVYHSHSNRSILPSLSDSERMLECPGEIWLIISYNIGNIRYAAWTILGYELGLTKINIV